MNERSVCVCERGGGQRQIKRKKEKGGQKVLWDFL